MRILAIETATEACSAALSVDGELISRFEIAPRRHTELILPMCDELLKEGGIEGQNLDAIAFGRGPGAFTGVRIAAGVTQGIAFALDLPVIPISTLAILAQQVIKGHKSSNVLAAIDARLKEVYWGVFASDEEGNARLIGEEQVIDPRRIKIPEGSCWYGAGSGWQSYSDIMGDIAGQQLVGFDGSVLPDARDMIPLATRIYAQGLMVDADQALPVYLRNKVANKPNRANATS